MSDKPSATDTSPSIENLESWQQSFESLRREFHRQGNHDGQRAMEFALEQIRRVQAESAASETRLATTISAGGAFELKLYGTPGIVGTIAGITIYADREIPENTVIIKDEHGRELGRIINVGR